MLREGTYRCSLTSVAHHCPGSIWTGWEATELELGAKVSWIHAVGGVGASSRSPG
jgi:hypothetical protein